MMGRDGRVKRRDAVMTRSFFSKSSKCFLGQGMSDGFACGFSTGNQKPLVFGGSRDILSYVFGGLAVVQGLLREQTLVD